MHTSKECQICHQALTMHESYAGNVCSNWRCKDEALQQELVSFRKKACTDLGCDHPSQYHIIVIPEKSIRQTEQVTETQLADFVAHLKSLLGIKVLEYSPSVLSISHTQEAASTIPTSTLTKICAACEGYCCHHGGSRHAFIQQATINRITDEHSIEPGPEIIALFLSHLSATHYVNSCVYHSRQGCSLPPEFRANICNQYECKGLQQASEKLAGNDSQRFFAVSRRDNQIVKANFIDQDKTRHYP